MPLAPLRYCAHPGCSQKVSFGRCQAHQPRERDRDNQHIRRWYRTARWAALRAQVMAAAPLCVECEKAGHVEPWTDLDHIRPHYGRPELFWDTENLQGLCASHHTQKTRTGG